MTGDRGDRLAGELRRWAHRPTRLSPRAARARLLAALPARRRRPSWRVLAAGAAAAGALALALLVGRGPEPAAVAPPAAAVAAERTIVHQLSSGTRLYIVVRPAVPVDEC